METTRLRHFKAVFEAGSVRKASETLSLTPSALSKSIHALQDSLGLELFQHIGKSLVLTENGKTLSKRLPSILGEIDRLTHELQENTHIKKEKPIRIATFEVFSTYFLAGLDDVGLFERSLHLYEGDPGEIESAVAEGRVDFGVTYIPEPYPGCEHIKITSIEMGVFAQKNAFLDLPQEKLPYVVPICPLSGTLSKIKGLDGWPSHAYERKIRYRVTLMESALELCRQGKAAGYFPAFVVKLHNKRHKEAYELTRRRYDFSGNKCSCNVYLVKRKECEETRDIKKIAKMLRLNHSII